MTCWFFLPSNPRFKINTEGFGRGKREGQRVSSQKQSSHKEAEEERGSGIVPAQLRAFTATQRASEMPAECRQPQTQMPSSPKRLVFPMTPGNCTETPNLNGS